MSAVARRLRLDVLAAYAARLTLTTVSLAMRPLPRQHKVTLLTRQSNLPSSDFRLLREALLRADPTVKVEVIARMVPPGVIRKLGYALHLLVEMYHASTSRVLVVDGYSIIASATPHSDRLVIVQLWHALGSLKKFGLSIIGRPGGRDPRLARAMRMHAGYDIVIASAERCRAPFAEAFGVDVSKVVVAPLPRVDRLRDPAHRTKVLARFDHLYPELTRKKVALFAPTFRLGDHTVAVDPLELSHALERAGYALITKLHPLLPEPGGPGLRTAPGISTQDLLLVSDIFITDYSSAVFEAAVAEVPSYLIAPDLGEYMHRRDFYIRYPHDVGLPMASSIDELVELVRAEAAGAVMMAALRDAFIAEVPERSSRAYSDSLARILTKSLGGDTDQ